MNDANKGEAALSALLQETRRFPPPDNFVANAVVGPAVYGEADADPSAWWAEQARLLRWETPWNEVLDWDVPFARWFVGDRKSVV